MRWFYDREAFVDDPTLQCPDCGAPRRRLYASSGIWTACTACTRLVPLVVAPSIEVRRYASQKWAY